MGKKVVSVVTVGLVGGMGLTLYNGLRLTSPTINDRGERGTGTSFADKYDGYSRTDMIEELYKTKAQYGLGIGIMMLVIGFGLPFYLIDD